MYSFNLQYIKFIINHNDLFSLNRTLGMLFTIYNIYYAILLI